MTPETLTSLKQNLIDLENDICHLAHKKLVQPENSYQIDKLIFLHRKIKRSIMLEIEMAQERKSEGVLHDKGISGINYWVQF